MTICLLSVPLNCKLHVAKDQVCSQPARCLALSKYLLSKWRDCPITLSRIATAAHTMRGWLVTSPTNPKQDPGSVHPKPEIPECMWICLAPQRVRYLGFSPATFSKGGAGQEIGLFYHLYFILGWPKEGQPHPLTSWPEILIYLGYTYGVAGTPPKRVNPQVFSSM